MLRHFSGLPLTLLVLALCLLITANEATAQGAAVIAPQIGQLIDEEDIDAARLRFAELIESPSLDINAELQGLATLMSTYMQAGNYEAGSAVAEMSGQLTQKLLYGPGGAFNPGAMEDGQMSQQAQHQSGKTEELQRAGDSSIGEARNDLVRFTGLYGEPGGKDLNRSIFVTVSCDGYLVTGPMWADVGPWWMKSISDKVFGYSDSWTQLRFEFTGVHGPGMMLDHDVEGISSPLEYKAPLPDDWEECTQRPLR